ncbi:MAG: hypothetical protein V1733_07905 [bacterium]
MYRRFAILSALFSLGFISISAQIYLLREFLYVFQGNELTVGIVLANWMLLTGFGAFIGRFSQQMKERAQFILFLLLLLSIIPILTLLKLDIWRSVVFPTGGMVGLKELFYSSLLLQTPVCFAGGFLFTALSSELPRGASKNPLGGAYAVESFGSMMAGALVNFVLLWLFGTFPGMKVITGIFLVFVILYAFALPSWFPRVLTMLCCGAIVYGLTSVSFDRLSLSLLYPDQEILLDRETPYGRVIITEQGGQQNVYENGLLLFSTDNVIRDEESVHFAMAQIERPKTVLLISGGLSGSIPEIVKYQPERIDYIELNPELTRIAEQSGFGAKYPMLRLITLDARKYIRQTDSIYSVVLVNLPEPSTLQLNRYYTDEFFRILKSRLEPGGVVSLSLPTGSDYVSAEAGELNACLFHTLVRHFRNVLIVPAGRNYFLASDEPLSLEVASLVARRGIETSYVNPWYFDENSLKDRNRYVMSRLPGTGEINHDFHPVAFFFQQSYWLSHFNQSYVLIAGIIFFMIVLSFLAMNRVNAGLFAAGFTTSSTEIILILAFQVSFGFVYQALGFIILVFMLGLAIGSGCRKIFWKLPKSKHYLLLQILLAICAIVILVFIHFLPAMSLSDPELIALFLLLAFAIAFLTGLEFSVAALLSKGGAEKVAAGNYSVDLYGSALGALLTTVLLLPLAGVTTTLVLLALLNTATAGVYVLGKRR